MSEKIDIVKRFLKLAYDQLHPDMNTMEGLEQALINWYCFTYKVPPNDDKLLDMTLEELMVLRSMHKLREEPALAEQFNPDYVDYEEWLKQEMGDEYVSEEEMIAQQVKIEEEEQEEIKKIIETMPEKVTTDFKAASQED